MKVTSGIRKGALLSVPADLSVRPTTDKVKQAIFNMIQFEIPHRNVLDLFAGSGALGIEALSRGASHCTFVDIKPDVVTKNIQKVRFEDCSAIVRSDFRSFLEQCKQQFDLVFLDPPYDHGMLDVALEHLVKKNLLLPGCLLMWECDAAEMVQVPDRIEVMKERTFGRVQIRIGAYR